MKSIKETLSSNIHKFETLRNDFEQKKRELKGGKITSSITKNLFSQLLTDNIPVLTKSDSRMLLNQFGTKDNDPFSSLRNTFHSDYNNLEEDLSRFVIVDKEGIKEGKKPKSYISSAKSVKMIDTKIRHVLDGLKELRLMEDRIIEKELLRVEERGTTRRIKTKAEILWASIEKNEVSAFQKMDENEYYDRKEAFFENKDGRVEDILVALANTGGGAIVYGIDGNKNLKLLNNNHRDKIENQIANLGSDRIQTPIRPMFHSIIISKKDDLGLLCAYIPKFEKHHHCTSSGKYLYRVGSNNKPIPPGKIK